MSAGSRRSGGAGGREAVTRREVAWALTLSMVLVAGVIGTLFLQTAMDTQARALQLQRSQAMTLQTQDGLLQRGVAQAANPAILARQAERLHMRPQIRPRFVQAGHRHRALRHSRRRSHTALFDR